MQAAYSIKEKGKKSFIHNTDYDERLIMTVGSNDFGV